MKFSLLEMTQNILSRMSSDEVNSISDTTESLQVAQIIKNKFYDIVARGDLPEQTQFFQLDPSDDPTKPVLMFSPDRVSSIEWLKYFNTNPKEGSTQEDQFGAFSHDLNTDIVSNSMEDTDTPMPGYEYVTMISIQQFMDMINRFNPTDDNVGSFQFSDADGLETYTFYYKTDHQPRWCTMISNKFVIFDSFDSTQDDTLQRSKTFGYGEVVPKFLMEDTFVPNLDDQQFPLLIAEATALAFFELKQMPHQKAEQEIKRGWSYIQKKKSIDNKPTYFEQLPSYGRVPRTGGFSSGDGPYRWMRGN